ncbi:glycine cleavage system T protein [Plectosphaerella plurivora]|uniref:Glycine cleavage system T protein n=1 Tax=Plectosphaerella plurivora TaxID=936078 RepID=A0A9P9A925_9PEZI|nr:glycine cleavage system T protein [Plectosphaerella plurivora]
MAQHRFTGPNAADFLERVTPSFIRDMPINSSKLSTFLWRGTGGIVDDTIITRTGDEEYRVVSNAGTREKIFTFFTVEMELLKMDLHNPEGGEFLWEVLQGQGLVALQGPKSAGMCLYGYDIDDTTTPVEAGLSRIIPKERRSADAGFNGDEIISEQLVPKSKGGKGIKRRRVGLMVQGAVAREGAEIYTKDGEEVGVVISGSPSPTLGKKIAMAYVRDRQHKAGTELDVMVRGKKRRATVTKMPFVPNKYYKGA